MRKVLRSLVWIVPTEHASATENLQSFVPDHFYSLTDPEKDVVQFIVDFYIQHAEAPSYQIVHDHFYNAAQPTRVVVIEEAGAQQFYAKQSFVQLVWDEVETQAAVHLRDKAQEALTIASQGLLVGKVTVKGVDAAISHLFSSVKTAPRANPGIPADMGKAQAALLALYDYRAANPGQTYGVGTGFGLIDASTAGIKPQQLWIHAGFVGHLKSCFLLNVALNAATMGGWNVLYFHSEMPAKEVQLMLGALHSESCARLGRLGVTAPLSSKAILEGRLSAPERQVFELCLKDLETNIDPATGKNLHGSIRIVDSAEFDTFGSIMQRTIREHADRPVDLCIVDYITRLPLDVKYLRMDVVAGRNETIADAKRFAMQFNHGKGLAVATAFQINREGAKAAETEGKLRLYHLAQYSSAEREADAITYTWYGKAEKESHNPKLGLLKSRWGDVPVEPTEIYLEPLSRRLYDRNTGLTGMMAPPTQGGGNLKLAIDDPTAGVELPEP